MYCKRLTGKYLFTIRPTARCISPSVSAPPVLVFSKGGGTNSAYSDTSLDSGHISNAHPMDIIRLVGSPKDLPADPTAGVFIAPSQRKYCFSESAARDAGSVSVL